MKNPKFSVSRKLEYRSRSIKQTEMSGIWKVLLVQDFLVLKDKTKMHNFTHKSWKMLNLSKFAYPPVGCSPTLTPEFLLSTFQSMWTFHMMWIKPWRCLSISPLPPLHQQRDHLSITSLTEISSANRPAGQRWGWGWGWGVKWEPESSDCLCLVIYSALAQTGAKPLTPTLTHLQFASGLEKHRCPSLGHTLIGRSSQNRKTMSEEWAQSALWEEVCSTEETSRWLEITGIF